jgi:hypothetical protein
MLVTMSAEKLDRRSDRGCPRSGTCPGFSPVVKVRTPKRMRALPWKHWPSRWREGTYGTAASN